MREEVAGFMDALLSVDRVKADSVVSQAVSAKGSGAAESIVVEALEEIGSLWEKGDLSLSQVYMAGVLSEDILSPWLDVEEESTGESPRIAMAVLEDHHALGKRMVVSLMRAEGLKVLDYGIGLSPAEIAERAYGDNIEVLCISTLMLHAALRVKKLRAELDIRGCSPRVIVGGAPFRLDPELWKEVGADGFGGSASSIFNLIDVGGRAAK